MTSMRSLVRTRWAAIGAAMAVSLGAGGFGLAGATTSSGDRAIYNAIEPCRLADTRPVPTTVGTRATPIGTAETVGFGGWGTVGNCTLPFGTTALSLNVTAVGATAPTFLQLFPSGTTRPSEGSNLNPVPGQPPTPNAVTVTLGADGKFNVYNLQGAVNVIIDVVGVFDHHDHDDIYYTKQEIDLAQPVVQLFDGVGAATFSLVSERPLQLPDTITTARSGILQISKAVRYRPICASGSWAAFLTLDGEAIPSSTVYGFEDNEFNGRLIGTTTAAVPAGTYEVAVGGECFGATTATGTSTLGLSQTTVLIFPTP